MKTFFTDIFSYHHHINQKIAVQLIEVEGSLPERTISLFSHSINAQQIWNARITNTQPLGVHQVHTLEECKRIDKANYTNTINILQNRYLDETIVYSNSKGNQFNNSIQEIFFHVANHFSHHRGQIISDIRQSGFEPIKTDYIFFQKR